MRLIDADALHEKANGLNWKERSVIQHALRVSPTIDAEPVRHGRWITDECDSGEPDGYPAFIEVHCSECGYSIGAESGQFGWSYGDPFPMHGCPNCGAKMDLEV